MQKMLLTSAAMALAGSISVAHAQNAPPEHGSMMREETPEREMEEHSDEGRRMMMMMAHSNAAIFHIRRGDTSVFIKCADNESTQACVTAAGTLLDKFNQQSTTPPKP